MSAAKRSRCLSVWRCVAGLLFATACVVETPPAHADAALKRAASANEKLPTAPTFGRAGFIGRRAWEDVRLSPDGQWLGFSHRLGNDVALSIESVEGGTRRVLLKALNDATWRWATDGSGVWLTSTTHVAWLPLQGHARSVYALKKELRPRVLPSNPAAAPTILVTERDAPRHDSAHRLLRVHSDGRVETLLRRPESIRDVAFDGQGVLRGLRLRNLQYRDAIWYNGAATGEGAQWQQAHACAPLDPCSLVAVDAGGVFFDSPALTDRMSLLRWQSDTQRVQLVIDDPEKISDLFDGLENPVSGPPLAVAWYTDRVRWKALKPEFATVVQQLEKRFPGQDLELSVDRHARRLLVLEKSAQLQLPHAYLMDLGSGNIRPVLADLRAQITTVAPETLAAAQFVSWTASDGMRLYGQLYLPPGRKPADVPLIALVHGGPFAQMRSEYHRWTQLLVNRGVAVFTPNFRASEGYGLPYLLAHKGDFGNGAVLRDVVEGMDALLAQGIGDRSQQAIVGHSFGGYASLMAVTHYPERFRFAIALAAPSDFGWTMKWYADNENDQLRGDGLPMAQRAPYLGVPVQDEKFLQRMREQSAVTQAKNVQVPVYLWAGARDDRVPLKSISHYAATLKTLNKPVSLLVDENASHNPTEPVQWEALFYLSERVLHAHFGGESPASASPVLAEYLKKAQRVGALP